METWPHSLPQCPLVEGYSEEVNNTRLESMPDAGAAKVRNRFTAVPINITENYYLTAQQKEDFLTFYHTTIKNGAENFLKPYYSNGQNRVYRISPSSTYSLEFNGVFWMLSLELQIMPV